MFANVHTPRFSPMPRPDVNPCIGQRPFCGLNQGRTVTPIQSPACVAFQAPQSYDGHGKKMTPMQSHPMRVTHVIPQPVQIHLPQAYHYSNHHVHSQVAYVPEPILPAYHYAESPTVNVEMTTSRPSIHVTSYPDEKNTIYHCNHGSLRGTLNFLGFLAQCVAISAFALFLLALMV